MLREHLSGSRSGALAASWRESRARPRGFVCSQNCAAGGRPSKARATHSFPTTRFPDRSDRARPARLHPGQREGRPNVAKFTKVPTDFTWSDCLNQSATLCRLCNRAFPSLNFRCCPVRGQPLQRLSFNKLLKKWFRGEQLRTRTWAYLQLFCAKDR